MKKEDILKNMRKNFDVACEYYREQREAAKEDFAFRKGDQWDEQDKVARESSGRPAETYNRLGQFVKQVVNNQKINRPEINVKLGDSTANKRTALILQAIIKNIQEKSFAENVYDTAFDCAVTCGEGYFRVVTDYRNPLSFDQDIYIESIEDYASVYIDTNFKSNYDEIKWAFIITKMDKDSFEKEFPDSEAVSNDFNTIYSSFCDGDSVVIVEYFYISEEKKEIHLLDNDIVMYDEDYQNLTKKPKIKKSRTTTKKVVNWIKSNGSEILEESIFPGTRIPIIPVFGDMFTVDGKKYFEGIVRQAKSSQKQINYFINSANENVGLLGKAKYMAPAGVLEGHERRWNEMHTSANPVLPYNPINIDGVASKPEPIQYDTHIQELLAAIQASDANMKSTIGIYDPSLGSQKSAESSGIALITKQRQAEVTSFMFIDNLSKALKLAGDILLEIIPIIYTNDRIIRIAKDNDIEDEIVDLSNELDVNFNVGEYTASVTIGPAGENARQEAIESMLALMTAYPDAAPAISDIFVAKQDWAGSQEIAERLKKMLPAQLQEGAIPPEIQEQITQAQQQYEAQIQTLTAQNQQSVQQQQYQQQLITDLTAELNRVKNDSENAKLKIMADSEKNTQNNEVKILIELLKKGIVPGGVLQQAQQGLEQPQLPTPQMSDEYILNGVNDPVTLSTQETPIENYSNQQQQDLSNAQDNDDRDALLERLQQSATRPTNALR